jgi:hypothetical protein
MAEAARAKAGAPATDPITITWSQGSGFGITPPVDSSVEVSGTVIFTTAHACKVWTCVNGSPTNVFVNQTGYYVLCNAGPNSFTMNQPLDTVVVFQPTLTSVVVTPACPTNQELIVKGSIKVGSMGEEKKERE